jgi:UDP-glucose 4-epimerase
MKILVTGGLGYIGSHTVVELQNNGYDVLVIDNLSNSSFDVLDRIESISGIRPQYQELELRDKPAVISFFKQNSDIDAIIHFAASKAVGESVENPLLYYENNLNTLIYLLHVMHIVLIVLFLVLLARYMANQIHFLLQRVRP